MRKEDISSVLRIQAECYASAMVEGEATIRSRHETSPHTAWVAEDADGVCAYLVAYPSGLGKLTRLGDGFEVRLPADCLYFHDLAVAGRGKGQGVGSVLVRHAWEWALQAGMKFSSLVSVQDTRTYWERLGYRAQEALTPAQQANLLSYPGPAWYMTKILAGPSGAATL